MLIESAKDSLRFSVTHYKHPKQPHTVQVSLRSRHTNDPFSLFFVFALIMCHFLTVRQFIVFALIIRHCVSQARTVEEKKLWAHHIKRLILENHHAVIPQKVRTVTGPQISVWISDTVINMICYLDLNVFISQTLFNSDIYLKIYPWDLKLIFQWFNTTFTVLWYLLILQWHAMKQSKYFFKCFVLFLFKNVIYFHLFYFDCFFY